MSPSPDSNVSYVTIEGLPNNKVPSRINLSCCSRMDLKKKFAIAVLSIQILFILLFAFFVEYGPDVQANQDEYSRERILDEDEAFHAIYPMFQDVNAVIFLGVGFLYTFLKKYGYMGVGMNMLLAVISVQWSILTHNIWIVNSGKIQIDIRSIITAEFAAASAVISLGAIFGKSNPLQMVVFTIIETFLYTTNEHFCLSSMKVTDLGGAVSLHLFASTFGLATAYTMDKKTNAQNNVNDAPSYNSNLFCMIGTVLLWCFWPSFNAALSVGDAQHRAALNTFLAFCSSCLAAFAMSALVDKNNKFNMSHIQNATLAGGVAVGATCELMIQPFGALLIGALGGCLCVLGFRNFSPFLTKIGIFDPCVINSLHFLPGLFAGITGIVASLIATTENYGHSLYRIYPAMAPPFNTTDLLNIQQSYPDIMAGSGRTPAYQACYQFMYVIECLVVAAVTGMLNGYFLKMKCFEQLEENEFFLDEVFWNMPELETQSTDTKKNSIVSQSNGIIVRAQCNETKM